MILPRGKHTLQIGVTKSESTIKANFEDRLHAFELAGPAGYWLTFETDKDQRQLLLRLASNREEFQETSKPICETGSISAGSVLQQTGIQQPIVFPNQFSADRKAAGVLLSQSEWSCSPHEGTPHLLQVNVRVVSETPPVVDFFSAGTIGFDQLQYIGSGKYEFKN